ncbi:MAG: RluA family pseudouridine synthase [Gammaproteobacteria bacterium]
MQEQDKAGGVRFAEVDSDRDGQRVDNFLSARLRGLPRSLVYRMIRTGQVRINGKRCKPSTRLNTGDTVRIPPAPRSSGEDASVPESARAVVRAAILYEDDDLLVVDKPAGMAVHAGSGLAWGVIDALRQDRPGQFLELVHRLDRETSGCLLLARNGAELKRLGAAFRAGEVDKFYLCLLDGRLPQDLLEVDAPLARIDGGQRRLVEVAAAGKPALTRFRRLEALGESTYAEAELLTGRTHQIRVHAAHLGMPLAGDDKYSDRNALRKWRRRGLRRIFLHAHRMVVPRADGTTLAFDAPLPDDLRGVLDELHAPGRRGEPVTAA